VGVNRLRGFIKRQATEKREGGNAEKTAKEGKKRPLFSSAKKKSDPAKSPRVGGKKKRKNIPSNAKSARTKPARGEVKKNVGAPRGLKNGRVTCKDHTARKYAQHFQDSTLGPKRKKKIRTGGKKKDAKGSKNVQPGP